MINESSVFELLRFDCIDMVDAQCIKMTLIPYACKNGSDKPVHSPDQRLYYPLTEPANTKEYVHQQEGSDQAARLRI